MGGWIQSNLTGPVVGVIKQGLDAAAMTPIGQQMIAGLQQGLSAAGPLLDQARSLAGGVVGAFKGVLGISSPSTVMIGIGENMVAGLEEGLEGANRIAVGPHIGAPGFGAGDLAGLGSGSAAPTINVYPSAQQDERQIAALVSRELAWATAGGEA
jgi:hypothetical protein